MIRKTAYILIGDDRTGKTTFQKYLILYLCGIDKFNKLNTNLIHSINHYESPRKLKTMFTINRSIQEKMNEYKTVKNYFENYFKEADICILSSHSHDNCINDIREMIDILNGKYFNVEVVFFTNHLNSYTQEISQLNWDKRNLIENPINNNEWENQIKIGAEKFGNLIISNSKSN